MTLMIANASMYLGPSERLLSLERASSTSQFAIIIEQTENAFYSCIQVTNKNVEHNQP